MKILYKNCFKKLFNKRFIHNKKLIEVITSRIKKFISNPKDQQFRAHILTGAKKNFYFFSVTGYIRIVFYINQNKESVLVDIGTHNQVYQ